MDSQYVTEVDYQVLTALATQTDAISIQTLAEQTQLDQSQVSAVCVTRAEQGEIVIDEHIAIELKLGKKGQALGDNPLPERQIIAALASNGGQAEIDEFPRLSGLAAKEVGQALRWLQAKNWANKQGKTLVLLPEGQAALNQIYADEQLVKALATLGTLSQTEAETQGIDVTTALQLLAGRSGMVDTVARKIRFVRLTAQGQAQVASGLTVRQQVNQLTPDMLRNGEWRNVDLRPYDVTLPAEPVYPGKDHPLVSTFEEIRTVFLELGFEETDSPFVESSFWDFDVLFQPQDHPARDMQDTFYVSRPDDCQLPADELLETVGETHRNGGQTGSVGWRYAWNRDLASKPVLRTHTTAASVRALAENPRAPRKVFCVGSVFRRETIDYKHLPVFHQVEGIIVDEHASFANLLGILDVFYRKMGFERFEFRPAFFPYTEPSVEIFVWSEKKNDWVEMGGAGMFRPEVTEPLGCSTPVLAWGLGIERLAMFRYDLANIAELYRARLAWLKEKPLCQ